MPPQLSAVVSGARLRPVSRRDALLCTIAAMLGVVVYLNALRNPFVYDDYRTIVENGSIRTPGDLRAIVWHDVTRPIANFSFAIDRAIWGPTPFGFHLTSVLLHVLNVVLLFAIARHLAADRTGSGPSTAAAAPGYVAFLAAALFAVHPLMTEAVGYISGRSEVLCGTFFFLAFLCGRRWMRGSGAGWWILTAALWAVALLTKELAAVLPIVLFTYDRLVLADGPQEKRRRLWRLHGPLVGLAVAAAAARLAIFGYVEHSGNLTFRWLAILDQAIVTWRYAALLVNPAGQAIYHQVRPVLTVSDVRAIVAAAALAAVVAAACFARGGNRVMRFGVIWFVLLLAPSALLYILGKGDAMAEHRVYLASAGLLLVAAAAATRTIAWLASVSRWHHALARAVIVVTLLSLAGRTVIRNVMWGDAAALWREASLMAPDDPLPHTVLGEELDQSGRYQEAVDEYRTALRLKPDDPLAYLKLGVCLATLEKFDEARAVFEQLRSVAPESPYVPLGHGAVALMSGQPDRARTLFTDVLRRYPDDVMTLQWLALLEEEAAADPAAALRRCEEIQNLTPGLLSNEDCIRRNRARLTAVSAGRR
jgi:Flp pilus assembly protein TadD